ncbi:MAG: GtrA family protein [Nitrospirae bacterium]|nr:GtrA family protein [Nitrospirota bacterium]
MRFFEHEFMRFVLAGAGITVSGYLLYVALLQMMAYLLAYTISFVLSLVLSYFLTSRFVFRRPLHWSTAVQFPFVYIAQYVVGMGLMYGLVDGLGVSQFIAPVVVVALTVPLTFMLSRLVIKQLPLFTA